MPEDIYKKGWYFLPKIHVKVIAWGIDENDRLSFSYFLRGTAGAFVEAPAIV